MYLRQVTIYDINKSNATRKPMTLTAGNAVKKNSLHSIFYVHKCGIMLPSRMTFFLLIMGSLLYGKHVALHTCTLLQKKIILLSTVHPGHHNMGDREI